MKLGRAANSSSVRPKRSFRHFSTACLSSAERLLISTFLPPLRTFTRNVPICSFRAFSSKAVKKSDNDWVDTAADSKRTSWAARASLSERICSKTRRSGFFSCFGLSTGLSCDEHDVNTTGLQLRMAAITHNVSFFITVQKFSC